MIGRKVPVELGHLWKILWGCIGTAGTFLNHHKRCIREADSESNKQTVAKVLVSIDVSIILTLVVNAIVFIVGYVGCV